jgi:thiol-disulfide isomerase/thioredoxin
MLVYTIYRDTLEAHNLYRHKLKSLIAPFNTIKNKRDFTNNSRSYLDQLLPQLFPKNLMWSMPDEQMFRSCFDSIHKNFTGIAREYLLSRVMARAYTKDIAIPEGYIKLYKKASSRKGYRNMVKIAKEERKKKETDTASVENRLLSLDGEDNLSFEAFMAKQKGKYVLVDFWASWCMPCIQEMPYWKRLMNSYPADKIYFLNLSIDNSTINWRSKVKQRELQSLNHFLLLNQSKTKLTRQYSIETIPRYLLFDKDGKILNADAPKPSDPALKQLLDSLLLNNPTF